MYVLRLLDPGSHSATGSRNRSQSSTSAAGNFFGPGAKLLELGSCECQHRTINVSCLKTIGKQWENHSLMGFNFVSCLKTIGKPWENGGFMEFNGGNTLW